MRHELSSFLSSKTAWVWAWGHRDRTGGFDRRLCGVGSEVTLHPHLSRGAELSRRQNSGAELGWSQADQNNWSPSLPAPDITLSKPPNLCPCDDAVLGWGREVHPQPRPPPAPSPQAEKEPTLLEFRRQMKSRKAVNLGEHGVGGGQAHILPASYPAVWPGQGAKSFHFLHCTMAGEVTSCSCSQDYSVGWKPSAGISFVNFR